jgi:secreted PhoX family phosphatase
MDINVLSNDSNNPDFAQILAASTTRRRLLQVGLGSAALSLFSFSSLAATFSRPAIGFKPIAASLEDAVRVPEGYAVQVLYAWGDPVSSGPLFKPDASNSAAEQAEQAGMNHDGMHFFPLSENGKPSSTRGVMCINHEYTDEGLLHTDGSATWSHPKTLKSQNAHGVSVIEVERKDSGKDARWQVVRPSKYARRITARTPMRISGPAAGAPAMRTKDDRRGNVVFGTLSNCAMGVTPWGTYLTCEENFNAYFNGIDKPTADQQRYGIREKGAGYRWHEHDSRFDVTTEPNEANRFGWVVEIDPMNPTKPPVKRTALGRIKHEGAITTLAADGRVVVYTGDDERFEYIYKFVSKDRFDSKNPAANANLLDQGTLYVASFGDDGHGQWRALEHGQNGLTVANGFADQADVLIRTRQAADRAGATKMDRPEWIAVHPHSGEVYCTLTNNSARGVGAAAGADAANPRRDNRFGHIIRWREINGDANGDAAGTQFSWDIYVLCGDPQLADENKRGNIKGDLFACPDGLWFDPEGRLWIQTDISGSSLKQGDYARFGNNQMLVADVSSGETHRFLTGPNGCEITGATRTPDGRSLFINIQHPGEGGNRAGQASNWPASQFPEVTGGRPRSATIVITRNDGGVIGA